MTESVWSSSDEKPFHCIHEELVKKNDDPSGLRGFIQNPYLFGIALFSSLGGLLFGPPVRYQSELSSPGMRGSMVSLYQLSITIGVAVSFWIDYGTSSLGGETSWRLPLYLQMIFGLILLIGVFFLPFSPRWLMKVGREYEALEVLARLRRRTNDDPKVVAEWKEIKVAVEFDHQQPQGGLFSQGMWRRVLIGVTLLFFQQLTGVNAIIYYAPSIVSSVGLTGNSSKLLATGVIGVIMVCCCIPTVLFLDRIGRRTLLLIGSAGMWLCMTALGALVTAFQSNWAHHSFEGWVAVSMIYLFMGIFAFSWGPCVWVISSELFPLRVRAKAMGLTSSSHWMNNFIVGLITPPLLALSAPATYFMFSGFCFLSFGFVWFLVPETRGYSLEDMDGLFGGQAAVEDASIMKKIRQDVDELSMNFKTPVV
ncbi:hypothetical protein [Absidia glauca]|uniref:Major facilitator superfamily (MFS) profile domain-containing protein n=1 Tax=Absidia glauca TaxID=4829 RepID=A0A163M4G6_ABSGL|nr:hypothetical protein [Absidia glauca]